jgi:hypothetical protein
VLQKQLHPFMFFSRNKKSSEQDAPSHCVPSGAISNIFHHAWEVASHAMEKHDARLRETTLHHRARETISMELERSSQARFRTVAGV